MTVITRACCENGQSYRVRLVSPGGGGILLNLIVTIARFRSRKLREEALKDLEHSRAILVLIGAQALEALLPLYTKRLRRSELARAESLPRQEISLWDEAG